MFRAVLPRWERLAQSDGDLIAPSLLRYDAQCVALAERFRVPLWTCHRWLAAELCHGLPEVHRVP
ncbi:MAG: hypothetical protein JO309_17055 [Pseudonocardiales bacterium]|nr:hypothetical protein [Pseudonocardiales bacterium]MBV9731080.1 hypothetical protein [Pseudonocardiales bacterium]